MVKFSNIILLSFRYFINSNTNVVDIIFKENALAPQKQYLDIFKLRFKYNKKQSEIAEELELSQSEVSKRLVEISKIVKSKLEN